MATPGRSHVINLSANWQAMFITAIILAWLSLILGTVQSFIMGGYISTGTWVFQITTWLLPLSFFVISYLLLGYYRPYMKRIFMACLATSIGTAFYGILAMWDDRIWSIYTFTHPIAANDTSWWSAFGNDWVLMLASLVVFAGGLYSATRMHRR